MVSSHIAKNTIVNTPMDHCSFMNTLRKKWDKMAPGKFPPLTARVAAANDFSEVFTSQALRPASTWPVVQRPVVSQEFLDSDFSEHPLGQLDRSIFEAVDGLPQTIEARKSGIRLDSPKNIKTVGGALKYVNSIPGLKPSDDQPERLSMIESDNQ